METGQPFLMPKENNVSESSYLSIHSFVDGFSFYTPDSSDYLKRPTFDQECKEMLESLLHYSPDQKYESVHWVCHDSPALFIPESQYSSDKEEFYWKYFAARNIENTLVVDHDKKYGLKVLYEENSPLIEYLESKIKSIQKKHYLHLLYHRIMENHPPNKAHCIYVHLSQDHFDLFVFKNNQFVLTNTFTLISEENFLYFLFYVIEQMKWESDSFTLFFLGKYDSFSSYYEAVRTYQNNIEFIAAHKIAPSNHPAPFLVNSGL